jgi:DNA-binding NarL/FixJ family response regulator
MKILLIDDHYAILSILEQSILKIVPSAEVISCLSLIEATPLLTRENQINYVITDLELFKGYNLEILRVSKILRIPSLIYSSHVNQILLSEANKLNVKCYISKKSNLIHLELGLKALLKGSIYFCPEVLKVQDSNNQFKETQKLEITKGQKKIVDLLSKGYSRFEIRDILNISLNTVNNQIARARELNDCSNTEELLRRFNFWDNT